MKKAQSSLIMAAMVAVLLGGVSATYPHYFVETGHYVCGEFLEFYETRGELEVFGYPLTEAFDDSIHGLRVQYFQRARMEWYPDNPDPYRVQLGLLVDELGYHFPPARPEQIPASNSALHHYFPETVHVVSYAFLDYFRAKGGLDIFGYPRSQFMSESGYIVQYFQRARMEWHPEAVSDPQMRLTNLGEIYIEHFGIPGNYDKPLPPPTLGDHTPTSGSSVTALYISASVRYVITGRQGVQTVFVYVTDQWCQPVQGAAVEMTVHYQSGDQHYEFNPTNASGFTRHSFDILPSPPGQKVVIDATVTYGNLTDTTQTLFLPWW